jgi:hypothetical protein
MCKLREISKFCRPVAADTVWVGKQNSDATVGTDWCSRPQLYVLCVCQQTSRTCRTELRHVSAQLGHFHEVTKNTPDGIRDTNKTPELQITSQEMDCNVTLKRVHVTIVVLERQYIFLSCLASTPHFYALPR